jgi:MFS family permease
MWVTYGLYLPLLLKQLGLPPQTALILLAAENAIAVILEPLMGNLSDRSQRWVGTRFPLIAIGVILASALFIAIPALAAFGNLGAAMQGATLFVVVAWALAMTIFHSPAVSLLTKYSAVSHLPLASSVLVLASGVVGTTKPVVTQFLLHFGATATFLVGSVVLLGATTILRSINLPATAPSSAPISTPTLLVVRALGFITAIGICVSWGTQSIMTILGQVFKAQLPMLGTSRVMMIISIGLAILTVPAGYLATRFGNRRVLCISLLMTASLVAVIGLTSTPMILLSATAMFLVSMSLVAVGMIPFALSLLPIEQAGLAIGMYFGATAAALSLFRLVVGQSGSIGTVALFGAIAFLAAALCVMVHMKSQRSWQQPA